MITKTIVDIETSPQPNALDSFREDEVSIPANWKDPEKIAQKIEEARVKWVEKAALSPLTGFVVAIGYLHPESLRPVIKTATTPRREKTILKEFFELLLKPATMGGGTRIVGYNFADFDLPFLLTRARLLNLDITRKVRFWDLKSKVDDVYDSITCGVKYMSRDSLFPISKLEHLAAAFGETSKFRANQCEGKDFAAYIQSSNLTMRNKARNHLRADLYETQSLAKITADL